jgi:DNA-binding response OmpR family regulator
MTMRVLVIGRNPAVVDAAVDRLRAPGVEVFSGTGIQDMQATLGRTDVDHVVIGAGIDLETCVHLVREVNRLSQRTTVHLKDVASGPDGLLPFARSVVAGFASRAKS